MGKYDDAIAELITLKNVLVRDKKVWHNEAGRRAMISGINLGIRRLQVQGEKNEETNQDISNPTRSANESIISGN